METLTLKPRVVQEEIECWDEDEDLQVSDLALTTTATNAFVRPSLQRDSISSRLSLRSDVDSVGGANEERQVLLPGDDEPSTAAAIASAISAGIPIPKNVPSSALLGGTIKRLGGKKSRQVLGDDWGEDLELPGLEMGGLKIKKLDGADFPDALRNIDETAARPRSPEKLGEVRDFAARLKLHKADGTGMVGLDKFRDGDGDEDDDEFFGDAGDLPTIKAGKGCPPSKPIPFPSTAQSSNGDNAAEDFEEDLEFPEDGAPLKLSTRKEIPKTPATQHDEFEEWTEGSLGTRHGGTRRDARSPRSSSISAMSPSVSSSFTVESGDEGLDGLVLPEGPLNFDDVLKKRQQAESPERVDGSNKEQAIDEAVAKEDFFAGIEIGDGDVFDSAKLTLNRNIKHKLNRSTSPVRRTAMTLTFTSKAQHSTSRIPRFSGASDRVGSTLEPVSESGGPVPNSRRTQSRLGGHSAQSSVSSIPLPATPSRSALPSTPSRPKDVRTRPSMSNLKTETPTTNAQLLRMKRSMPAMRSAQVNPTKGTPSSYRPPSRSGLPSRPKTPVDRSGAESSLSHARKAPPIPFLPAGMSHSQSHHISAKSSRNVRRHESETSAASGEVPTRSVSRAGLPSRFAHRSPSPRRKDVASESLAREAAAKRTVVQPAKRRYFGNGSELEIFDDLPTSASNENKFTKAPIGRGAPKAIRSKLGLPAYMASDARSEASAPVTPLSPLKQEFTPRFARDTNASRLAREQRTGVAPAMPMAPLSTNWKASMAVRGAVGMGLGTGTTAIPRAKRRHGGQKKPHLIKPLGDTHNNAKSIKGMHYNPTLYRWEGNENALAPFDAPLPPPAHTSPLGSQARLQPAGSNKADMAGQRPALITNITTASPSVQVVGGMVFDPQRMCWLKLSHHPNHPANQSRHALSPSSSHGAHDEAAEDSDDPFAGMDDLPDERQTSRRHHHDRSSYTENDNQNSGTDTTSPHHRPATAATAGAEANGNNVQRKGGAEAGAGAKGGVTRDARGMSMTGEWLVGEEFDVGPEFIRRQRDEEVRWRRKVEMWTRGGIKAREEGPGLDWRRWAIKDVLAGAKF